MNKLIKSILTMLLFSIAVGQTFAEDKITFYHYDLLGSPVATTDKNGKVYDNHTPQGLPRKDFEKDLHHQTGMKFTEVPFSTKAGYKNAKDSILSVGTSIGALGTAIGSTLSEEAEAAYNDPVQAVVDWSVISDIAGDVAE